MIFTSDNASGAHPKVMQALLRANQGYADSYGDDAIMAQVTAQVREVFEAPEAAVYLVATGTAANVLSLASLVQPWQAIYCHSGAHINTDECGAPEFYTGGSKLVLLDGEDAKFDADTLQEALEATPHGFVHSVQRGAVSITNVTEAGAVYSPDEVAGIGRVARDFALPLHMDGARIANALVACDCTPAEMTWRAGVDVLSFGGTKNGLLGVEAVVMFDPARAWEFELRRKRAGHLPSKHRYLSAQMQAYLQDGLWLEMARHANAMGARLARGIDATPGTSLLHPPQSNQVFAGWPRAGHRRAQAAGAAYFFWPSEASLDGPDDEVLSARLVCSWSTTEAEVDRLLELIRG
jgi:threonine aldolase